MNSILSDSPHDGDLARSLGRLASGVFVVTANHEGTRIGMLSTWIGQASFAPPVITLAVAKDRPLLAALSANATFSVNVLARRNSEIFKAFARPHNDEASRFDELSILEESIDGIIFKDVVSALICRVHSHVAPGDHVLVIAEVTAGRPVDMEAEPMVHLRNSGLRY
ncbi:MAG: flavin reductase family protein [Candidatus Obscuribacterales bacterium]|nr:flavin reductase family protein [Candidatus Obscuribacterales bacterium]